MEKKSLLINETAPPFCLPDQNGGEVCLNHFSGKWVVLYFYPKDNTPGCTTEAIDFSANQKDFEKLDAVILGVSPDSVKSHQNFCQKKDLTISLLADVEKKVLNDYGVWQLKKMYGREYFGVVRTTVLIDPNGTVREIWPKVKVKGHSIVVLEKLKELQQM